jgi:hypothetical protein
MWSGLYPKTLEPEKATSKDQGRHWYFPRLCTRSVRFGLRGMGVAPAGVDKPNTGHHHLLIDTTLSPEELKQPIASYAQHLHFGSGQTETELTLPRGRHTLQLVLGGWSHIPFNPPIVSSVITVTVKTGEPAVSLLLVGADERRERPKGRAGGEFELKGIMRGTGGPRHGVQGSTLSRKATSLAVT